MMKPTIISILAISSIALVGCSKEVIDPAYQKSDHLPNFKQASFTDYVEETQEWLSSHRVFMTDDKQFEIDVNSPAQYTPTNPNGQAVLLVHGLGDSPYSFHDVATHLADQGYLVRTVLLPGHGSKVGDLQLPTLQDWQEVVDYHTQLLQKEYDSVWLGGYSTGANLVTSQAINDPSIKGLMLFSPAFQPFSPAVKFAGVASHIMTWADQDPEDNPLRYNSLPMNGASVYYQTSEVVRDDLEKGIYDKPVFIMMSEGDSVIDTEFVRNTFANSMTNDSNMLIWQSEHSLDEPRSKAFSMALKEQRISNGSHMGLLFSPDNPYYGINGTEVICSNGQGSEQESECLAGGEVWYSSWGYTEQGKNHARLTYNPYFNESMQALDLVLTTSN
ncbi:alpha/beta fold hydrolase [Vibrio sp. 99-70-13A1]|uniref:alpha/beta fold hydrolase n=1 Tax=Vibrio sp. 99-70-13A1 TaxID=2607601 RepID=UPI001493693B|nr:alpha/beta fold hydrolase [Vibrio sp. 99-70-13A1]NOH98347.1 alpha/beta fold hydrolase [Vibrio sp. 99-70-13A1]